jgi:hypothetical protein
MFTQCSGLRELFIPDRKGLPRLEREQKALVEVEVFPLGVEDEAFPSGVEDDRDYAAQADPWLLARKLMWTKLNQTRLGLNHKPNPHVC